jgi:hypothetical protein
MRFLTFDSRLPASEDAAELGSFASFESFEPMEKSEESLRPAFFLGASSMMQM